MMVEVAWWVPWLFLAVGVLAGLLMGAVLTVDTLREHGWGPPVRWFGFRGDFDDENWSSPESFGTWVAPDDTMPDEIAEVADAIYRPGGVVQRGGTFHWEAPTVVPWPHLGERR